VGWAKYHEDNEEILQGRLSEKEWRTWEAEQRFYASEESIRVMLEQYARVNDVKQGTICFKAFTSLDYRIQLLNALYCMRSAIIKSAIVRYRAQMEQAKEKLNCELKKHSGYSQKCMTSSEKVNEKHTLVYQLIDNAFLYISKIYEDNTKEIHILCDDMRALINWDCSGDSTEAKYIFCEFEELIKYLKRGGFFAFDESCAGCRQSYFGQNNYCIKCYQLNRKKADKQYG
jgi:hypothetical protein